MDIIPVVSQVKSFAQFLTGDNQGALRTQENFSRRCPVVSQTRSFAHYLMGDNRKAKEVQLEFLETAEGMSDGIPIIGHIKGGVHYARG